MQRGLRRHDCPSAGVWRGGSDGGALVVPDSMRPEQRPGNGGMRAQQALGAACRELGRCDVLRGPAWKAGHDTAVM